MHRCHIIKILIASKQVVACYISMPTLLLYIASFCPGSHRLSFILTSTDDDMMMPTKSHNHYYPHIVTNTYIIHLFAFVRYDSFIFAENAILLMKRCLTCPISSQPQQLQLAITIFFWYIDASANNERRNNQKSAQVREPNSRMNFDFDEYEFFCESGLVLFMNVRKDC